jgi:hypothetical protein
VIVATEVRLENTTPEASVEPVSDPAATVTVHGDPRVQVCPLTVVAGLARALFGIAEAATAKDGVVVELVTVGTSHEGQLEDGAEKLVTLPVPAHHVGAALTVPVPVWQRTRVDVVVLPERNAVVPERVW